jgi:hypothetical protein
MDADDASRGKDTPILCSACYGACFCARCKGYGKYPADLGGAWVRFTCRNCGGSGVCPECGGTGRVKETPEIPHGLPDPTTCWACDGSGCCTRCGGDGHYVPRGMQAIIKCDRCDGSGGCRLCGGTGRVRYEADRG